VRRAGVGLAPRLGSVARSYATIAASIAALCAGCATNRVFERYLEAGLYEDAVRTFEADSTLWNRPETLLLAGRMFADPTVPSFDAVRARSTLERLVTVFPESEEAAQGGILIPLLTRLAELGELERELDARTAELERRAAQAVVTLADTLAAVQLAAERDLQALRRTIARLEADLDRAREELERLKAIDLRRRPGDRR
jgi:hypothetical protein